MNLLIKLLINNKKMNYYSIIIPLLFNLIIKNIQ
jgi:hypothetical protein